MMLCLDEARRVHSRGGTWAMQKADDGTPSRKLHKPKAWAKTTWPSSRAIFVAM